MSGSINKFVYFDEKALSSWIKEDVGRRLAADLEKLGYATVNYDELIKNVRESVKNNSSNKVIVFANDIIPKDLLEHDFDPMNGLIMRFIANGNIIVWIGDVPFWYRDIKIKCDANCQIVGGNNTVVWIGGIPFQYMGIKCDTNCHVREETWGRLLPFTALGVFTVFTESPQSTSQLCDDNHQRCATWISRRPIVYPPELEANELESCGKNHSYIYPLTKTVVAAPRPYPQPPKDMILSVSRLKKPHRLHLKEINIGIGMVSVGMGFENPLSPDMLRRLSPSTPYWEAAPAWIKCFGRGFFIRLFDEPWDPNFISDEEIRNRAYIIDYYVEKALKEGQKDYEYDTF